MWVPPRQEAWHLRSQANDLNWTQASPEVTRLGIKATSAVLINTDHAEPHTLMGAAGTLWLLGFRESGGRRMGHERCLS